MGKFMFIYSSNKIASFLDIEKLSHDQYGMGENGQGKLLIGSCFRFQINQIISLFGS